jgi:hypothetical protein
LQQVLVKESRKYELGNPNPFLVAGEEEELASCGYKYRKWTLNADEGLDVVSGAGKVVEGMEISHEEEEQLMGQ